MSSKLQLQSVEETRKFNTEREMWNKTREALENRVVDLEAQGATGESMLQSNNAVEKYNLYSVCDPLDEPANLSVTSATQLRSEIGILQSRGQQLERILSTILNETEFVEKIVMLMKEAKLSLQGSSGDRSRISERT